MDFYAVLDQVLDLLRQRGRVTYNALKRQFGLDDACLQDLKDEIIAAQHMAVDEDGTVLVWTGDVTAPPPPAAVPASVRARAPAQHQAPLAYTPPHLAEKILTSRTALEGERKQVTVFFADLKDSTRLIEGLDPEAAQQLLDPAIHLMMDAVHRFEGTVNQVLGDGIMALFGAPIAHEDHALRACYAALAVQNAIRSYAEAVRRTHGMLLQLRVGLNAGEVVVRAIGNDLHMDYSAVGQHTVLAARMEHLAAPGSILLTAAVLRLVEGLVHVNALGPLPVKGFTEPVEGFEQLAASDLRRRLQAAALHGLTRFVGRELELAALTQALMRAGAGHGQVVALVGEAGVGKSRLVYECVHSHRTQGWRVLEAASVSYGKATPYFPVLDLLKRYAQVDDHDDARTIRAKATGHVLTLDETLQETLPALLSLLEALPEDSPFLHLDPPQRRQRTLAALQRLLLRDSQVQPLLLVFEDLHWIDSETRALLDSLVERLPTAQLLLLVNYRPEYQHGWGSKTYYTQLRLDPLPPASAAEVLQALLGDDASLAPLKQLLIERTEGNPFFLEESVRTLVETRVLVGASGAYVLVTPLDSLQVPATVQAVLAARIDQLPAEEKRLLQTAAVIGTDVSFALLRAIADLPEAALHRGLAYLQAAEFLYETCLFPEPEYTFKHALTHEVVYGSLLHERRRAIHACIVEAIEALYSDRLIDHVERLAHHALRGENWDKALNHSRQAGIRAAARSANREAVTCFEQALGILQALPKSRDIYVQAIDLRLHLSNVLFPLGEFGRILNTLSEAAPLAEALDDRRQEGRVSSLRTEYFWMMGDNDRAVMPGRRALTLADALGDFALQVRTTYFLGQIYHSLGDYHLAIDVLNRSVASLEGELIWKRLGMPFLPALFSRTWMAFCLAELGAFAKGITRAEEAVQIAEAVDHPFSRVAAYVEVGHVYFGKGDFYKAIPRLEQGLELCRFWNFPLWFPWMASILGSLYVFSGRVAEALPLLEEAVEQAIAMQLMAWHAFWVARLSEAYLRANRIEEAMERAVQALKLSRTHKQRGHEAYALRLLGEVATRREPPESALAAVHYQQALALAEELGMRPLMAHCHHGLGRLYSQTGRVEQAHAALTTAIGLYRAMDMTFWLPQAEAALAQVA